MKSSKGNFTIGFYNLENLFDTVDNPFTRDDDFTPNSEMRWTRKRLERKLGKLSTSISRIGQGFSDSPPVLLGISEVENQQLLQELIDRPVLKDFGYRLVHFDSPDRRGMDTALLYQETDFTPLSADVLPVRYTDEGGETEYSRDILYVEGMLYGVDIDLYVNHWPSRREGVSLTRTRREKAAQVLLKHFEGRQRHIEEKRIATADRECRYTVVMGDLNDRPQDPAPKLISASGYFQNPFAPLSSRGLGTLSYRGKWFLFDQILLSQEFFRVKAELGFVRARIFNPRFLGQYRGPFKGHPFRTYAARRYKGGYSDHFPVFVVVECRE